MAISRHLQLVFVTPERAIAHDEVDEIQLPLDGGYAGILPGHAPLLSTLQIGEMWYRKGTEKTHAFVEGGFVEVLGDRVSILAQVAEKAEDIDTARAEAAKHRAEELLTKPSIADFDAERARIALLRAITRLQVSSRQYRPRP
jgi:F-type H+-transporting ATPase subunit epsilon